jgi:hypothetical protein
MEDLRTKIADTENLGASFGLLAQGGNSKK